MCTMSVSGARKGPLELDLWTVMRHHASAGNQTWSLCQCSGLLGRLSSPPAAFWHSWTALVASHPYNLHIKIVLVKCPLGL